MARKCPVCGSGLVRVALDIGKGSVVKCSTQTYNPQTKKQEGCAFSVFSKQTNLAKELTAEQIGQCIDQIENPIAVGDGYQFVVSATPIKKDGKSFYSKVIFPEREEEEF